MKNFANTTDGIVLDSIRGFCDAHSDLVEMQASPLYITRRHKSSRKVALVSGGGSGHEPLHCGFVGQGMLDAACPGELLTSPTPDQIAAAIKAVDNGNGILLILKNYQGDKMNFELAKRIVQTDADSVIVSDDASFSHDEQSRGIAGVLVFQKILGAAAEDGATIEALKQLAEKVNQQTKSVGVAMESLVLPDADGPMYDIPVDQMEYGVGIHGEKGKVRIDVLNAKEIVEKIILQIVDKIKHQDEKRVLLFVNGLGGAPLVELYIVYAEASKLLVKLGYQVVRSLVGNYVTTLSLNGCSITVAIMDEECQRYWDAPVVTPHLCW